MATVQEDGGAPDVLLLATPPAVTLALLPSLCPRGTVMDVASAKEAIVTRAGQLGLPFVGGHPLAGSEGAGPEDGDPEMFEGRPFFLAPAASAGDEDVRRALRVAQDTGAVPTLVPADEHDAALALTSHLVWTLSRALGEMASGLPPVYRAGPAYQAFARPGRSPEGLWREILELNSPRVSEAWNSLKPLVERTLARERDASG